jgi:hypothetical protein
LSQCPQITIFTFEFQLFKYLNMKITRTAPDVFNIWFRRTKGCELTNAELTAILASIDFSVNPDFEGLPLNFMQEVYEALSSAREKMLKHERIKKGLR